jgi:hypothetical protein
MACLVPGAGISALGGIDPLGVDTQGYAALAVGVAKGTIYRLLRIFGLVVILMFMPQRCFVRAELALDLRGVLPRDRSAWAPACLGCFRSIPASWRRVRSFAPAHVVWILGVVLSPSLRCLRILCVGGYPDVYDSPVLMGAYLRPGRPASLAFRYAGDA